MLEIKPAVLPPVLPQLLPAFPAYTQEMQAKVVEAQAEVPQALSQALRDGHMGVMDYYNMNNIMADTKMRETIAEGETTELTTQPNPRNK